MKHRLHSLPLLLVCVLASSAGALAATPKAAPGPVLACHYTYGGEEKVLRVTPVRSPYAVEPIAVGSYFLLKVIFQTQPADMAGIHIYVYADREPSPVPIHQVSFPWPPQVQTAHGYGFTGRHWVYEPVRDGEMQYWCERTTGGRP